MTWDKLTLADERRKVVWKFWGMENVFVLKSKVLSFKSYLYQHRLT